MTLRAQSGLEHDETETGASCWCCPTVECPLCGLGPLCRDEDHVKVIIHREAN